jgi:hypothetical protein
MYLGETSLRFVGVSESNTFIFVIIASVTITREVVLHRLCFDKRIAKRGLALPRTAFGTTLAREPGPGCVLSSYAFRIMISENREFYV